MKPNIGAKTSLLQKTLPDDPDIEILFTKPTKIMGVTFLQKVAPTTFLLTKLILESCVY